MPAPAGENTFSRILRGEAWNLAPGMRYLCAALLAAAALGARLEIAPVGSFVFVTFYPAVVIAALLFGARPGLLTVALSVAAAIRFLLPPHGAGALDPHTVVPMILFAVSGALICSTVGNLHRSVAALHASERKLRSLFEASRVGIVLTDERGRFIEFNESFRRITGYDVEELAGLDYWKLTPKKHLPEQERQLELLRNTGQFGPFEKEYERKDGSRIAVQLNGAAFTAPDGARRTWTLVEDTSARSRANELIARLVREQSTVVENRLIGLVRVKDRRITWCNATFAEMFGYLPHELVGQPSRILYPDDASHAEFRDKNFAIIERGGITRTDIRQIRKDGSIGWFEISCGLLSAESREQIGVFVDISARRAAQAALEASEARLREAQRIARIGSWEVRAADGGLYWSDETFRIYGVDAPATPSGIDAWLTLIHPDDAAVTRRAFEELLRAGTALQLTHRVVLPGGDTRTVQLRGGATPESDGGGVRHLGTAQDVSEMTRQQEAAERNNERLRRTFESMAEGLVLHGPDGRIVEANAAAERILGLTRAQLLAGAAEDPGWRTLRADGSPYPPDQHPAAVALRSATRRQGDIMGIHAPGKGLRWISINSVPLLRRDAGGVPEGAVATFVDITELRRVSEDLQEARADLESILNNVPARITAWNADHTNRFINDQAAAFFGVQSGYGRGLPAPLVVGRQRHLQSKPFTEAALRGETQSRLHTEPQPDGSVRYSHVQYVPRIAAGRVVGYCTLATDVTELRRSYERISELAQRLDASRDNERRMAATLLHEGIAQDLFAAKLALSYLESQTRGRAGVTQACRDLTSAIDRCIASTRQMADTLRPASLSHLPIADSLGEYARKFGERSKLEIEVTQSAPLPALDETSRMVFFRATQEALDNVERHAHATRVAIHLSADDELVSVRIADDGIGIAAGESNKAGALGLFEIRERLIALGGGMVTEGNQPKGTALTMFVPRKAP